MKYALQYHGKNKEGLIYFTIITDDERKLNQCGIDICFHHYIYHPDKRVERISYMEVPTFKEIPSQSEANDVKDKVTRHFSGIIPLSLPVFTGNHAEFFKSGGQEKMADIKSIS